MDEDGYTPYLRYISDFTVQGRQIYEKIERYVTSKNFTKEEQLQEIDLATLLDDKQLNINNNQNLFGGGFGMFGNNLNNNNNKYKELALKVFDEKIAQPFALFLEKFVELGANPHNYVDKTQYYRDASEDISIIRKRDSFGNVKNQYCDNGLSNALHLILEFPSKAVFDSILNSGVSTDEINIKKMTPFFMLIKTKDTSNPEYKYCLDKFISSKSDIDSPDQFGVSAFWYCYQNQKVDLALYLASKGADINRIDNYGFFALKSEVFNNNLARIQQLIGLGADINKKDEFQRTVLHHVMNRYRIGNDLAILKYLIGQGADLNSKDFKNRLPVHYLFVKSNRRFSIEQNDPVDVITEIINQGKTIDFDQQDNNGNTVVHYICQRQAVECLRLLKAQISSNQFEIENNDGNTPTAVALITKHENTVRYILNNFVIDLSKNVYKRDKDKNRAGNNVQGEESDFEYMMTIDIQQEQKDSKELRKHRSYFEYCVKAPELNKIAKLLLEKGYSITDAFKDAFKAGNYQQLFQLLNTMDPDTVKQAVNMTDENGCNIFHALAKAPDNSPFSEI